MDTTPGTILYPGPGVVVQTEGSGSPEAIAMAHRPAPDTIITQGADGTEGTYTIDPNALQSYNAGIVKFTDNSGTAYEIRPLDDTDGQWLSRYQANVPASALRNMISGQDGVEGVSMSQILKDQRETMVAFQFPDDNFLFGLLYINKFGSYIYTDGSWVMVPQNDDTFDDTYPFYVNPDTVDDFLDAWNRGPVSVQDAEANKWVLPPDTDLHNPDEQQPQQDAIDEPDYEPDSEAPQVDARDSNTPQGDQ